MAKGKERAVLYRAVRFELQPTHKQEGLLKKVSDNLRLVWNEALSERIASYEAWKLAKVEGREKEVKLPTLFDQINILTERRKDPEFGNVPRNWQEETLDRLDGSFKSFFALVKRGDPDARPPRERKEGFFQVMPGRSSFSIRGNAAVFAPNLFGRDTLSFQVPEYCLQKLSEGTVKKFTISRDVHDLSKSGKYWCSIVYEVPQPELVPVVPEQRVYLALGASALGVLAQGGVEETIKLWRPDKHWKPKIESVEARMKSLTKGSRKWCGLRDARKRMFEIMSRQQKQNHREIVAKLLALGRHFVVTEYVVRSKKGKLADGEVRERSGSQGLNWAAQNTGSFLDLLMHLEEKVKEFGGSVTRHELMSPPPQGIGSGHENKVCMAHHLRNDFLREVGENVPV